MAWVTAGVAVGSSIWGALKSGKARKDQKRAEANLENLAQNSPLKKESKEVNDYYQEALNRYKESPYQSAAYQQTMQNARRTTASGLSALQDRRSAIGGISKLGGMEKNASLGAIAQGEQMKSQRFNQLGQASQMKKRSQDDLFENNVLTPYQRKLQLEQMKGAAAGERYNAGQQMIGQGISTAGTAAEYYNKTKGK
jgi:hypothetical protein